MTPITNILETERLSLRLLTADDALFMLELLNSPGWLKYIGDRDIHTVEAARSYIVNGALKSYEENGFGPYLICRKTDGISMGVCGLFKRPSLDQPDIGFAFLADFFGQGYAYEAASAVTLFVKTVLRISPILAITIPENRSSIKLLEKIGLKFKEMIHLPNDEKALMLFTTASTKDIDDG